ncbi:MAG: hypothetical protein ACRDND_18565 [Streptosporangiaceae bacterium]
MADAPHCERVAQAGIVTGAGVRRTIRREPARRASLAGQLRCR